MRPLENHTATGDEVGEALGPMNRPRLKDFRGETIDMDCRRCDRHGVYDRKALMKKFGARIEFVEIRRRLAIGATSTEPVGATRPSPVFSQQIF